MGKKHNFKIISCHMHEETDNEILTLRYIQTLCKYQELSKRGFIPKKFRRCEIIKAETSD